MVNGEKLSKMHVMIIKSHNQHQLSELTKTKVRVHSGNWYTGPLPPHGRM